MNKKTLSIVGVVVAIIVIALVVVGINTKTAKAPESLDTSTPLSVASTTPPSTSSTNPSVAVQAFYSNGSFSFSYPTSWSITAYSPFSMNNFGGKYLSGGIIPSDGGVISVVTTTIYGPLQDIMTTELQGATNISTTTLSVDGIVCPATADQSAYAPGALSKNVSVYCQRGKELWKIYLSYSASGTSIGANVTDFNGVLASMKFLPQL